MYLQVIGHTKLVEGLEDAIERALTIRELTSEIRQALFHRRVYIRHIYTLLDIMTSLQLVRPATEDNVHSMQMMYLERKVNIPCTLPSGCTLHEHVFNTITDVGKYWDELESLSLSNNPEILHESATNVDGNSGVTVYDGKLPLLYNRSSWSSSRHSSHLGQDLLNRTPRSRKRKRSVATTKTQPLPATQTPKTKKKIKIPTPKQQQPLLIHAVEKEEEEESNGKQQQQQQTQLPMVTHPTLNRC